MGKELLRIHQENIERNIPINFTGDDGLDHVTFIDFRVNGILFEVKNSSFMINPSKASNMLSKLDVYRANNVILVAHRECKDIFDKPVRTGMV